MPSKVDKVIIAGTPLDRRVKLLPDQKAEIKYRYEHEDISQRQLAREYDVDRRTIAFIVNPDSLEANLHQRKERGGSRQYYDKATNTFAVRKNREYKKKLIEEGVIK